MLVLKNKDLFGDKTIEIITDDHEITHEYLEKGIVSACFSTREKALANCESHFIGYFNYILVASPEFKKQYFSSKDDKKNLLNAPAVIFDHHDKLRDRYLKKFFNIAKQQPVYHVVPLVQGFRQFSLLGYAYALIPESDVRDDIKNKNLVQLYKKYIWKKE